MARPKSSPPPPPRRSSRRLGGFGLLGAAIVGVVLLVVLDEPLPGVAFESAGNTHITDVATPHSGYVSSPPSSGPHLGGLAPWGVHDDPVPPELFVHNLEDGGIVFTYDCPDGCPELVGGLGGIVEERGGHLLLTPYAGIEDPDGASHRAAVVAWSRVLYVDELDDPTRAEIDTFIDLFEGVDHHGG